MKAFGHKIIKFYKLNHVTVELIATNETKIFKSKDET